MNDPVRWDFFLAHAGADSAIAATLDEALRRLGAKVFFDRRCLQLGDPWSHVLPAMLKSSTIIVALVSSATRDAPYEDSEIRIALDLVRDFPERYRVVALLLDATDPIRRTDLPFGLERRVLLSWRECDSVDAVARRLYDTLQQQAGETAAAPASKLVDATTTFVGETAQGPVWPMPLTCWEDFLHLYGPPLSTGRSFLAPALRAFFDNGGERAYVVRVVAHDASVAMLSVPTGDIGQRLAFRARSIGAEGNCLQVRIQGGSRRGVRITISGDGPAGGEDYDNLSPAETGPNPLLERVSRRSERVLVAWSDPEGPAATPQYGCWTLSGGSDGGATVADYVGNVSEGTTPATGVEAIGELTDVALICLPDAVHPRFSPAEQLELTQSLVARAERDHCIALLALPLDRAGTEPPMAPTESACAAVFTPWLQVPALDGGPDVAVPAVGHVAGGLARHDRAHGLHISPAGLDLKGVISTGVRAAASQSLAASSAVACARRGVNLLQVSEGSPPRVRLGSAVSSAVDEDLAPLAGRRVLNYVARMLAAGTAWVAHAPSGEATWAQLKADLEEFLTTLWRAGVLVGDSPEEAFFVRCGRDTMTDDDIDNGRVIVTMGVALAQRGLQFPSLPALQAQRP